ncbi:MAG: patatin-like phospholipase family protein [Bacteroidota bacterium]
MRGFFIGLLRSFPVQLLLLHLRSNLLLILLWLVLLAFMSGQLASSFGIQYLFLDPEYLGKVNVWSFMIVGLALGFFTMSWNLTTYLLNARYFSFLASLSRPFFKFCLNNSLVPLLAMIAYLSLLIRFNAPYQDQAAWNHLFVGIGGLLLGFLLAILIYALYFYFTNRDIEYYRPNRRSMPHLQAMQPGARHINWEGGEVLRRENPFKVRTYLGDWLKTRLVRSVSHYDRKLLERVFKQNHWNAIFLQFATIFLLILLGLLIDYRPFQVPAAASILILFSLIIAIIGAISYWAFRWRLTILIMVGFALNWVTSTEWFSRSNYAYGLDYEQEWSIYGEDRLIAACQSEEVEQDRLATEAILNRWKTQQAEEKPKMVIVSASGGGLTAALWSSTVMQRLGQRLEGQLMPATMLMTGASGGMLGLAYQRELYRRNVLDRSFNHLDPVHLESISKDLINPIAFSIVSNDMFLPFTQVEVGGHYYYRDRAYSFERKLDANTEGIMDHSLGFYQQAEEQAEIPLLFLTPSLIDDGRRLTISPQPVRYMMAAPQAKTLNTPLLPDAVDFGWLLGREQADSLRFLTALRMNATYPYVLPFVQLPTQPSVRVIDAGFRDNYGVLSAARFLQVFKYWILENTSGVVLIQISVHLREEEVYLETNEGVIESLFNPLGLAGNILDVQDLEQDNTLGFLYELLGPDQFHLLRFRYRPQADNGLRESISFHLTERERNNIIQAIALPEYESALQELEQLMD